MQAQRWTGGPRAARCTLGRALALPLAAAHHPTSTPILPHAPPHPRAVAPTGGSPGPAAPPYPPHRRVRVLRVLCAGPALDQAAHALSLHVEAGLALALAGQPAERRGAEAAPGAAELLAEARAAPLFVCQFLA